MQHKLKHENSFGMLHEEYITNQPPGQNSLAVSISMISCISNQLKHYSPLD